MPVAGLLVQRSVSQSGVSRISDTQPRKGSSWPTSMPNVPNPSTTTPRTWCSVRPALRHLEVHRCAARCDVRCLRGRTDRHRDVL